ncbi:hypothetical protein HZB05_00570 [Candidatus Wolfebacteria bacterium]|nr:hypothetical protein [Candidatus Wolfebacteria bacterium]
MNEEKIVKILQNLKSVKPDRNYSEKSRMLVLLLKEQIADNKFSRSKIKSFADILRLSTLIGAAIFLLLFLVGGVSYINKNFSPLALEGLNQKSLVAEAENINSSIQITLEEIKYLDQSNQKAIKTIEEVSKNKPIYIAPTSTILISTSTVDEFDKFLIENNPSSTETQADSIDELLNQISQ